MPAIPPASVTAHFRAAQRADAEALRVLAIHVFLDTYAADGITSRIGREADTTFAIDKVRTWLTTPGHRVIVAEIHAGLTGFAHVVRGAHPERPDAGEVELNRLYVRKNFIGQGVGRRLLQEAEAVAAREGARALWLTAWAGNAKARAFYARQGYEDIGRAVYVFEDQEFENRLLTRRLGPT
ncbi:MAG: GNAT family N-acetyltransferase [Burkholderiaceae bacterium]